MNRQTASSPNISVLLTIKSVILGNKAGDVTLSLTADMWLRVGAPQVTDQSPKGKSPSKSCGNKCINAVHVPEGLVLGH